MASRTELRVLQYMSQSSTITYGALLTRLDTRSCTRKTKNQLYMPVEHTRIDVLVEMNSQRRAHQGVECAGFEVVRPRRSLLARHVHQQRHGVLVIKAAGIAVAASWFIGYDLTCYG
jgi:hypothetical protein